jgi:amino acid transporter
MWQPTGMTVSTRMGVAVAAGVPVLVLLSLGPVTALVGVPSILVWSLSALMGLFMALAFVDLAASYPEVTGGVGVLAAQVWRPRSPGVALLARWSYWFGWSPALAINGALVGGYLHDLIVPGAPTWAILPFAIAVLTASMLVNHLGMRVTAALQAALMLCVVVAVGWLSIGALARGAFDPSRLRPFSPPAGWTSGHGLLALAGGLFIAGWSAYGAELALSYGTEYRSGVRDAVKAVVTVAGIAVVAYTVVPLLLVGVLGADDVAADPEVALRSLARQSVGGATNVVMGLLVLALLMALNMVTVASSRTLYQMGRNGDAWRFLARLNRHGVPSNALKFDLSVNIVLLLLITAMNRGRTSDVPIALLAAANVGYFLAINLALVASWLNHRSRRQVLSVLRLRKAYLRIGLAMALFNAVLLLTAGAAVGWPNLGLGAVALTVMVLSFAAKRPHGLPPTIQPTCMAWGHGAASTHHRTAEAVEGGSMP